MTKKQAFKYTIQMWNWLSKNPNKFKLDFLKSHPKYPQNLQSDCALCTYAAQQYNKLGKITEMCDYCLLKNQWGEANQSTCTDYNSYFLLRAGDYSNNAHMIAKIAKQELDKLPKGSKY